MSDYLQRDTDSTKARLGEDAEKAEEKREDEKPRTENPRLNDEIESEKVGKGPSKQRVITYEQLLENKKRTKPFRSNTETGEFQQEISC